MGGLISAKFLLVLIVALVVLGPEKLPDAARTAGRLMSEFRRVTGGLQNEVREAFQSSDLANPVQEFRTAAGSFRSAATGFATGGPISTALGSAAAGSGTDVSSTGRPDGSVGAMTGSVGVPMATTIPRPWSGDLGLAPGDPSLN